MRQGRKPIRAVTLDAAGTMFELAEPVGVTYARIAESHGVVASSASIEAGFRSIWKKTAPPHSEGPEDEVDWWRRIAWGAFLEAEAVGLEEGTFEPLYRALFDEYEKAEAWSIYPDTIPFLERCRREGLRIGALSNFDDRLVTILTNLGMEHYFDVIVTSATAKSSKPDPAIFELAASKLECETEEILHIGDEPRADWEGGRAAGFQVYELARGEGDGLDFERILASDRRAVHTSAKTGRAMGPR